MSPSATRQRTSATGLAREGLPLLLGLIVGGGLLPALIYGCGVTILGRYEGGSLARVYQVVLGGLTRGSIAAWIVFLGPYALYQLARLLRRWWHSAA